MLAHAGAGACQEQHAGVHTLEFGATLVAGSSPSSATPPAAPSSASEPSPLCKPCPPTPSRTPTSITTASQANGVSEGYCLEFLAVRDVKNAPSKSDPCVEESIGGGSDGVEDLDENHAHIPLKKPQPLSISGPCTQPCSTEGSAPGLPLQQPDPVNAAEPVSSSRSPSVPSTHPHRLSSTPSWIPDVRTTASQAAGVFKVACDVKNVANLSPAPSNSDPCTKESIQDLDEADFPLKMSEPVVPRSKTLKPELSGTSCVRRWTSETNEVVKFGASEVRMDPRSEDLNEDAADISFQMSEAAGLHCDTVSSLSSSSPPALLPLDSALPADLEKKTGDQVVSTTLLLSLEKTQRQVYSLGSYAKNGVGMIGAEDDKEQVDGLEQGVDLELEEELTGSAPDEPKCSSSPSVPSTHPRHLSSLRAHHLHARQFEMQENRLGLGPARSSPSLPLGTSSSSSARYLCTTESTPLAFRTFGVFKNECSDSLVDFEVKNGMDPLDLDPDGLKDPAVDDDSVLLEQPDAKAPHHGLHMPRKAESSSYPPTTLSSSSEPSKNAVVQLPKTGEPIGAGANQLHREMGLNAVVGCRILYPPRRLLLAISLSAPSRSTPRPLLMDNDDLSFFGAAHIDNHNSVRHLTHMYGDHGSLDRR
uniref:Uncharacterized protein n=1 Tax=Mycena chlorophos TaxID=658473 RepID=A0ABQ0L1B0_MYCCL|nr:predicted protein [Mycena chlorophos]